MKLLANENGYSVYENPDNDLKEKIVNLPDTDILYYLGDSFDREEKWSFEKNLENGNVLLKSDKGNFETVTSDDYHEILSKTRLELINRTFNVSEVMNKYFLPFRSGNDIIHSMLEKPWDLYGVQDDSFYSGVNSIYITESFDFSDNQFHYFTEYGGYYLNGLGHTYLNIEGNIENRNHNNDFNNPRPIVTKEETQEKFLNFITERIGNGEIVKNNNDEYFTDDWAFTYECKWDKIEFSWKQYRKGNYYYKSGGSAYKLIKRKKGNEVVDKEQFLEKIKGIMSEYPKNKFWIKEDNNGNR